VPLTGKPAMPQRQRLAEPIDNTDTIKDSVIRALRNKGFRLTPQREKILEVFQNLPEGEHLSADELFQIIQKEASDISLATLYRTLKLLVSMGALRELDFSEDHKHYEIIRNPESPHHHIICMDCGKTAEFESPEIIALAEKIALEKNIELVDVQLKIFANCLGAKHDADFLDHESLKHSH